MSSKEKDKIWSTEVENKAHLMKGLKQGSPFKSVIRGEDVMQDKQKNDLRSEVILRDKLISVNMRDTWSNASEKFTTEIIYLWVIYW